MGKMSSSRHSACLLDALVLDGVQSCGAEEALVRVIMIHGGQCERWKALWEPERGLFKPACRVGTTSPRPHLLPTLMGVPASVSGWWERWAVDQAWPSCSLEPRRGGISH